MLGKVAFGSPSLRWDSTSQFQQAGKDAGDSDAVLSRTAVCPLFRLDVMTVVRGAARP